MARGLQGSRLSSCGVRAYWPPGMWDPPFSTTDWTCVPCIGRWILNHRTTREVPHSQYSTLRSWHKAQDGTIRVGLWTFWTEWNLLCPLPQITPPSKSLSFLRVFIQALPSNGTLFTVISLKEPFVFFWGLWWNNSHILGQEKKNLNIGFFSDRLGLLPPLCVCCASAFTRSPADITFLLHLVKGRYDPWLAWYLQIQIV